MSHAIAIKITGARLEALKVCIAIRYVRYATEVGNSYISSALSAEGDTVVSKAVGLFAQKGEKEGRQGWKTRADDAEANFNAGPELGHCTCI